MQIIKTANYEEMSRIAAEKIINLVKNKPNAELGLATGGTPEGLYKLLIQDHRLNGTSYKQVKTVNLDEYIGLKKDDPNSYYTFMTEKLFKHIDILPENTHVPNGMAADIDAEAERYENFIHEIGGVDLQILGIGHNGHIAFNEPGTSFQSKTHVIDLAENTRQANARYFDSIDAVPTKAITMGIQTIMDSKEIILLVSGASKAEALKQLIHGEITEQFPASVLRKHNHVTIIADEAALQLI
ncbi:MAG: glucosamine-6-phosphate deaminase [Bacillus sp. (in: firmicutes)]